MIPISHVVLYSLFGRHATAPREEEKGGELQGLESPFHPIHIAIHYRQIWCCYMSTDEHSISRSHTLL